MAFIFRTKYQTTTLDNFRVLLYSEVFFRNSASIFVRVDSTCSTQISFAVDGASDPEKLLVPALPAYGFEVAAAIVSAGFVAPLISIIDKAIFSNASGKEPMVQSLVNSTKALVSSPLKFVRSASFLWIWFVYGGTYTTANSVETFCNRNGQDWFYPKFVVSSTANVSLSLVKDRAFSKMFGVVAPKPVPAASFGLFAARDSMTIAASFNMPSLLSERMQKEYAVSKKRADVIAQLFTPIAMQVFSTPLHLLGMNLYNNPTHSTAEHTFFIRREYTKTLFARMGRIFPAFGIGGVTNRALRTKGHTALDVAYIDPMRPLVKLH